LLEAEKGTRILSTDSGLIDGDGVPENGRPESRDLVDVAATVAHALSPFVDADWSVRAGSLEWDVERTVSHMIGACAKYTLYLASHSHTFIALTWSRFDDATQAELVDSIRPVAEGLANVASWAPADWRGYHVSGTRDAAGFVALACEELLIHTHDALEGLGGEFEPLDALARTVLRASYPNTVAGGDAWSALLQASGRRAPRLRSR